MDTASIYTIQVSTDEDLHPHAYHFFPSSTTSLSPTLVNNVHYAERPSLKLRFSSGASDILNSLVIDAAGQSLYSISSNTKRTTIISCTDNVEIARVQWDRSSPRMVFRRKKWKCRYWLPRTTPKKESRILTHGDSQYTWTQGSAWEFGHLTAVDRPGVVVAQWHIQHHTDELILEIFQEMTVESGLLESIVLSVVLLRSGRPLGDFLEKNNVSDPMDTLALLVGLHNRGLTTFAK